MEDAQSTERINLGDGPEPAKKSHHKKPEGPAGPTPRVSRTKPKAKTAPRDVTPAAYESWQRITAMAFLGARMFVPERWAPTERESNDIGVPLSRIAARHLDMPEISEDASDGFALLIAVSGYANRVLFHSAPNPTIPTEPYTGTQTSAPPPGPRPGPGHFTDAGVVYAPPPPPSGPGYDGSIRYAQPGEGVGLAPEELVGSPEEVLRKLHQVAWTPDMDENVMPAAEVG